MGRLAGRVLQIKIDSFSLAMSKINPKEMAMEQLVRGMERDCPECVGCRETKLQEHEDHMRMAKLFAVTCKHPIQHQGDIVRCPDGFFGMYDATAKEVREVKLEMPVTTTSLGEFDGSMSMPSPRWEFVKPAPKPGDFEREHMTAPFDPEKAKMEELKRRELLRGLSIDDSELSDSGISKIAAGLAKFGPGSSTGLFSRDSIINPQIPSDRFTGQPAKPRNKDVPQTADEGAW